ncbi:hypothetical protein [Thermithiobacillus plumbiphilus]|uniref:Uncharacterized protein n=1 Tax=Thermithiobacillus plumbiphilus TaxID=1729899 RepID=A0ABU9D8J2_9PROT
MPIARIDLANVGFQFAMKLSVLAPTIGMTFPLQVDHYRVRDDRPKEVGVMKRSRFSEEQIIGVLKEAGAGMKVAVRWPVMGQFIWPLTAGYGRSV